MVLCVVAVLAWCGACQRPQSTNLNAPETKPADPTEILRGMLQAYDKAISYSDRGVVRLRYLDGGAVEEDTAPFSVTARYPSQVRIDAYQATLVSDGEKLYARVRDPSSGNLDNQLLVRAAPEELTLDEIFRDLVLQDALTSGLARHPVQLELLYAPQPLAAVLDEDATRRLLPPQRIDGHACYRVEAKTAEGAFVFCVDQQTSVLRRLVYPVETLAAELASAPGIQNVELVADFRDARLGPRIDDAVFRFEVPAGAKQVRAFVPPPQPLPSQMFGRRPQKFVFPVPGGGDISQQSLEGSIAVLLWFNQHPACQASLAQLNQVYAEYGQHDELRFVAVCVEPSHISDEVVRQSLQRWQIEVPLARDVQAYGRDVFQIPWAPTLLVLDRDGRVQIFEVGANPRLEEELPVVLDRLLAGDDLAAEILETFEREQMRYEQLLAAAQGTGSTRMIDLPLADVKPRSAPASLKLTERWQCLALERPGNMLALYEGGAARIFVCDGDQAVVELDAGGEVIRRYSLPIALGGPGVLRTAVDGGGQRRFAATTLQGRQVHLFDERWNLLFSYPPLEQPHDGIVDVQLADLDPGGGLELLVAFAGMVGVHCVSERAEWKWSNRVMPSVLSLATAENQEGKRRLLVTGERGDIVRVEPDGGNAPPVRVPGAAVFHLFAKELPGGTAPAYCGLTYSEAGNLVALGLDEQLHPQWSYPLPQGSYQNPIQLVTSGVLADGPYWVIAGPDGTVHFIRHDGQFSDHFACGELLTGIAALRHAGQSWLLAAASTSVTAWTVEPD